MKRLPSYSVLSIFLILIFLFLLLPSFGVKFFYFFSFLIFSYTFLTWLTGNYILCFYYFSGYFRQFNVRNFFVCSSLPFFLLPLKTTHWGKLIQKTFKYVKPVQQFSKCGLKTPAGSRDPLRDRWGQNYFHNGTKMLIAFFIFILLRLNSQWSFQRLPDVISRQTKHRADMRMHIRLLLHWKLEGLTKL